MDPKARPFLPHSRSASLQFPFTPFLFLSSLVLIVAPPQIVILSLLSSWDPERGPSRKGQRCGGCHGSGRTLWSLLPVQEQ